MSFLSILGGTTVMIECFVPLHHASPDRACRSLRVHVPSLSSFRCQLPFICLHLPARVEALPGTQGFHYLHTAADMVFGHPTFCCHPPATTRTANYPRLGNYWELLPAGALLPLAAVLVVGHIRLPRSGEQERPSLATFRGKPFLS